MPRFQLLVRESNREPRIIPITQLVVVGRSKKAEITIDDDEVGREQFRIGPAGSAVRIEGIGRTNKTTVDGRPLDAGQQVMVPAGATIKVGKTVFIVQVGDATDASSVRPGDLDGTMVATPRTPPRAAPAPDQEATGGGVLPGATMQLGRPGSGTKPPAAPNPPSSPAIDRTMSPGVYRPGQPPTESPAPTPFPNLTMPLKPGRGAAPTPPPAIAGNDTLEPGMTMPLKPGRGTPGPAPTPPAAANDVVEPNLTMPLRPGRSLPQPTQATPPPALPPAPPRATPPPIAPPPPPAEPVRAEAPAAATPGAPVRPKTVMMTPSDMASIENNGLPAAELEARLHQCNARLVVKGDGVKRRVRLLKVRTKVGRAENADVLLPAESVSEQHAEILFDGTQWQLQDNGSTNGSTVDGTLVRGKRMPIQRDSLLAFGSLRAIFLSNDPADAAASRRRDSQALRHLVQTGRLSPDVGKQVQEMAAADSSQSMAEILLLNTPIEAVDWSAAAVAARSHTPLLQRLLRMLGIGRKPAS